MQTGAGSVVVSRDLAMVTTWVQIPASAYRLSEPFIAILRPDLVGNKPTMKHSITLNAKPIDSGDFAVLVMVTE